MIIDFHTHAFPDLLAPRAMSSLQEKIKTVPNTNGTVSDFINQMDKWGVDRSVVCNIATNPRQTEKVNNFAIYVNENYSDRLTALGSINPGLTNIPEEFERLAKNNIPGIKIHPDYMEYDIDSPEFDMIFDCAAEHNMFIITHAGFDVCSPRKVWASPQKIANRLNRSPDTVLIAAHFGGNMMWDEVIRNLAGKDIYIDTSMCTLSRLPVEKAMEIISKHASDKILFGSDCPWCSPKDIKEYMETLPLSDGILEKIFHKNAEKLLNK